MQRLLAHALMMVPLLLVVPVHADEGPTWGPYPTPGQGVGDGIFLLLKPLSATSVEIDGLTVVYPDGGVDTAGILRVPGEGPYRAMGGSAQCADVDHDGSSGLVGLSIAFEPVGDDDRVGSAQAEIVPDEEIDEPGIYSVRLRWNDEPAGEAVLLVRSIPAARR